MYVKGEGDLGGQRQRSGEMCLHCFIPALLNVFVFLQRRISVSQNFFRDFGLHTTNCRRPASPCCQTARTNSCDRRLVTGDSMLFAFFRGRVDLCLGFKKENEMY